jgi:5-methylcytosine-specific restriction endonuclease McrA
MQEIERIHNHALQSVKNYKKCEFTLLVSIQSVDLKRVYQHKGFKSLYDYCVSCLGLSEGTAYSQINVARKAVQVPEVLEAIRKGQLSLSHAKTIASVITPENHETWIKKASTLSVRELEREVVKEKPKQSSEGERIWPIAENLSKLDCLIDSEIEELLLRAQDLLCQKRQTSVNIRETLRQTLTEYIQKNDPLEKKVVRRNPPRGESETVPYNNSGASSLTQGIKRSVLQRDKGQCQARDPKGNLCGQRRWVDVHHIHPLSMGGTHAFDNLIVLCQGHHKLVHLRG